MYMLAGELIGLSSCNTNKRGDFKEVKEDKKGFDKKMKSLTATLAEQMEKAGKLDKEIKKNLKKIGYEL